MNFKQTIETELDFIKTGNALGRKYKLSNEKDEDFEYIQVRPVDNFKGYYSQQKTKKDKIVLHFTVGHLKGDILSLTSKSRGRVSTSYILGRTGTIFELFDPQYWSYHLGRGALGGNGTNSKRSIGIEISNYGPLIKKGSNLETVYSTHGSDIYCSLDDTNQYIKLDKPFRGYQYWASFTDEQYTSLIKLIKYLSDRFDIPKQFIMQPYERVKTLYKYSNNWKGICSHVNFRTDKLDIGYAFKWDKVISGVLDLPDLTNLNPPKV